MKFLKQIDAENKLNEPAFREMIINYMSLEKYAKSFAHSAAEKCVSVIRNQHDRQNSNGKECSDISISALICAKVSLFDACPVEKQNKKIDRCGKLRKIVDAHN